MIDQAGARPKSGGCLIDQAATIVKSVVTVVTNKKNHQKTFSPRNLFHKKKLQNKKKDKENQLMKKSNCDEDQKLKLLQNPKTSLVTNQKLKL